MLEECEEASDQEVTNRARFSMLNDVLRDYDGSGTALQTLVKGYQALQTLKNQEQQNEPCTEKESPTLAVPVELPLEVQKDTDSQMMEQDFTTEGKPGGLGCPFATKVALRKHQRPDSLPTPPDLKDIFEKDPIAAEFHASQIHSPPPSADVCALKCPIRFLDQHSPEEVAKYFEKHKHEIPRSHEICVKRYQSNSESIRKLDAKYGNLVNMIQGLGMKHQPMFPAKEMEDTSAIVEAESLEKVKNWAVEASEKSKGKLLDAPEEEEEVRSGHFDRPLKEVRLGESPSRPWGIQVPISAEAKDTSSWFSGEKPIKRETTSRDAKPSVAQCPFRPQVDSPTRGVQQPIYSPSPIESYPDDPVNIENDDVPVASQVASLKERRTVRDRPVKRPPMVFVNANFTGSVFVGYDATEAQGMMARYMDCIDGDSR